MPSVVNYVLLSQIQRDIQYEQPYFSAIRARGRPVIILSPSSKIDKSFLKGAKKRLKSWGLDVVVAKHAGSAHGTYAGSIQQRLKDLQEAMDDEKAKVILCSRGGYGAVHLGGTA